MEIVQLHPLTESEKARRPGRFLRALLTGGFEPGIRPGRESAGPSLAERLVAGATRDPDQVEVDVVVTRGMKTWGIEVKAGATLGPGDGRGLRRLAGRCGEDFESGVLLYAGMDVLSLGDRRMLAVPLSGLWSQSPIRVARGTDAPTNVLIVMPLYSSWCTLCAGVTFTDCLASFGLIRSNRME